MPQMSQVLRERKIGMMTAGMSTRAVAISRLQRRFREFGGYVQPALQLQTTCHHASPGPPHPASYLHLTTPVSNDHAV